MSLPKPYYEKDGYIIYHGDCREILPELDKFDLVLTDPPYGIGRDGKPPSTSSHGGHKGHLFLGWDGSAPTTDELRMIRKAATEYVLWGANYFPEAMTRGPGWLLWDKGQRICQADGELAASSRLGPLRIFTCNRIALARDGAVHPTQKPVDLMRWCLTFFPDAKTVLDPFMGSGTTLVAAKLEGRRAVGIEIEERYCEIAANRLRQNVLCFTKPEKRKRQKKDDDSTGLFAELTP